ncbi:MAG: hypothetical protein DRP87_05405 [Spirochaetes bacterium]|nr:MAG: hypothetical protein DRP87_05405 [Spirochaetota bacterium]
MNANTLTKEEKIIVFFSSASHFFAHFYILVFPALVMPISRALQLPLSRVVDLSFYMYLLYGLISIPWGLLSDHVGHKWAMGWGVIIAGTGMFLAGLVSLFGASLFVFSAALALVGIGCSAYHPSGMALVSQGVRHRGKALGVIGIVGNIGMASVPFTVGLLNYVLGWQKGLMVLGVVGALLGLAIITSPLKVEKGKDKIKLEKLKKEHAGKLFFIFLIGVGFAGLMYRSFTVVLPSYLELELGNITQVFLNFVNTRFRPLKDTPAFNTLTANLVATAIYLVGIFGQYIGGKVADRASLKWAYMLAFCFASPFILGMILFSNSILIVSAGMFLFFTLGMQPVENSLVAFLTPAKWRSVSYGLKFTVLFGTGSFAVKIVSLIESSWGIKSVMWMVGFFLLMVVLNMVVFLIVSRGKKIDQKVTVQ